MGHGKFVTAINCMDGRVQEPTISYMKKTYGVDYVDMITEPGPDKILSENSDKNLVQSIKNRIDISVQKHGSKVIAMIGHDDCAGNPVSKEEHIKQVNKSIEYLKSLYPGVEIIGLWIDGNWKVSKV